MPRTRRGKRQGCPKRSLRDSTGEANGAGRKNMKTRTTQFITSILYHTHTSYHTRSTGHAAELRTSRNRLGKEAKSSTQQVVSLGGRISGCCTLHGCMVGHTAVEQEKRTKGAARERTTSNKKPVHTGSVFVPRTEGNTHHGHRGATALLCLSSFAAKGAETTWFPTRRCRSSGQTWLVVCRLMGSTPRVPTNSSQATNARESLLRRVCVCRVVMKAVQGSSCWLLLVCCRGAKPPKSTM